MADSKRTEIDSAEPWGKALRRVLLAVYLVLSATDLFLTWFLVRTTDRAVYESNPFANAWLVRYGWGGLFAFKAILVVLVSILCLVIARSRPRLSLLVLVIGCVVTGAVVVYSWILMSQLDLLGSG